MLKKDLFWFSTTKKFEDSFVLPPFFLITSTPFCVNTNNVDGIVSIGVSRHGESLKQWNYFARTCCRSHWIAQPLIQHMQMSHWVDFSEHFAFFKRHLPRAKWRTLLAFTQQYYKWKHDADLEDIQWSMIHGPSAELFNISEVLGNTTWIHSVVLQGFLNTAGRPDCSFLERIPWMNGRLHVGFCWATLLLLLHSFSIFSSFHSLNSYQSSVLF